MRKGTKGGFEPAPYRVREKMFDGLMEKTIEEGDALMDENVSPIEMSADSAIRRLREDMIKIRHERDELLKRQKELDEEEQELLLSAMMETVDPMCVQLGITLERAVELMDTESARRNAESGG